MGIENSLNRPNDNKMQSLFDTDVLKDEKELPFHRITTDHDYMVALGLGSFTTGVLYRWWNEKDGQGNYVNHKFFAEANDAHDPGDDENKEPEYKIKDKTVPRLILFGEDETDFGDKTSDIGKNQFSFSAWRSITDVANRTAGSYVLKYADESHTEEWNFYQDGVNEAGAQRDYSMTQVNLSEFLDKMAFDSEGGADAEADVWENPDGGGGQENVIFKSITPITEVINLNDYVNDIQLTDTDRSEWDTENFARNEFVTDIIASKQKAGKQGFVEWSGLIPFQISTAPKPQTIFEDDDTEWVKCVRREWVKFKLYLYPAGSENSTKRGLTLANPVFAGAPVSSLGDRYGFKEDGRYSAFPEGSKAAEVVADLDLTYNEYTGKWEGGSKQMIGIIDQQVPGAQVLTITQLKELRPEDMLLRPDDPNAHIIFGSGTAMPLTQQNGNPKQWTPNYAETEHTNFKGEFIEDCEPPSTDKAMLTVYNASLKQFEKDDMVLLNQIDGQWFCIDFPSGVKASDLITPAFEGKWEFTSFATNLVHYFRDKDFKVIDSEDIEHGFHHDFYRDDEINKNRYGDNLWEITELIGGGYHQFSSFDMMDGQIGGRRPDGNAYCVTNPITAPNGLNIGGDQDGDNTGSFFGVIFPDGYSSEDIAAYRSERNWTAWPTIAASGKDDEGRWTPEGIAGVIGDLSFQYFNESGIPADVLPFNDGEARNDTKSLVKDDDGNIIQMLTDDDTSLTNVPADIMLNAGPSGTYGRPLNNLHFIERMYNLVADSTGKRWSDESASTWAQNFFKYGQNWLYKYYEEDTVGVGTHMEEGAFDFKPRMMNRIMFRPLKMEVYSQFSINTDEKIPDDMFQGISIQPFIDRHNIAAEIAATTQSLKKPSSHDAYLRELNWDKKASPIGFTHQVVNEAGEFLRQLKGNIYSLYNDYWGLQWNVDIPTQPRSEFYISPKAYLTKTERFRKDAYGLKRNFWMHGGATNEDPAIVDTSPLWRTNGSPAGHIGEEASTRGGGGIGVIGAVCTARALERFIFTTDYRVGTWSWTLLDGLTGQNRHYPSWGKGTYYRDFNTTVLNVKIYHSHPREATIYDPRYFAVHHFNEGIISFDEYGEHIVPITIETISQRDPEDPTKFKKYAYQIDDRVYDCDGRVPSCVARNPIPPDDPDKIEEGPHNLPEELDVGDLIYGDGTNRFYSQDDDASNFYKKWQGSLIYDRWVVDPERRGKLLPYKYAAKKIIARQFGVKLPYDETVYENGGYAVKTSTNLLAFGSYQVPNSEAVKFYEDDDTSKTIEYNPVDQHNISLVVRDPGVGYKVDETLTCNLLYGAGVDVRIAATTEEGQITGLEMLDVGTEFTFGIFHNTGVPITQNTNGKVKLVKGGSNPSEEGTAFSAFLTQGVVGHPYTVTVTFGVAVPWFKLLEDPKPAIATDQPYHVLAQKSVNKENERTMNPFGLMEGNTPDTVEITNPATDGRYDLFFHYHNDISHTFLSADNHPAPSRWGNDEQYMILEIDQE